MKLSKLYQHFRVRDHPCGLQDSLPTLSPSCSPSLDDSAMGPRLDTGGWLALTGKPLSSSFPTGTLTLLDTLSLSQRDNVVFSYGPGWRGPSTILCQGRANRGYPGPPRPSYDSGACGTHEPAGRRTSSNSARRRGTCGRRRRVRRVRCPCSGTGVGGVLRAQRRSVQDTSSRFRPTLEYGNTRHALGPIPVRIALLLDCWTTSPNRIPSHPSPAGRGGVGRDRLDLSAAR